MLVGTVKSWKMLSIMKEEKKSAMNDFNVGFFFLGFCPNLNFFFRSLCWFNVLRSLTKIDHLPRNRLFKNHSRLDRRGTLCSIKS